MKNVLSYIQEYEGVFVKDEVDKANAAHLEAVKKAKKDIGKLQTRSDQTANKKRPKPVAVQIIISYTAGFACNCKGFFATLAEQGIALRTPRFRVPTPNL